MSQAEPIRSSPKGSNSLFLGGIALVGVSAVGGYVMLFQQSRDLRVQNALLVTQKTELEAALKSEKEARTREVAALTKAAESTQLAYQSSLTAVASDVSVKESVPEGRGWIYICKVANGRWSGLTLERGDVGSPEGFADKSIAVTDSVYIRDSRPALENQFKLGQIVGVARRGQSVRLGQVVQTRPGTWYGEVREVTGTPLGDRTLGSGFFKKKVSQVEVPPVIKIEVPRLEGRDLLVDPPKRIDPVDKPQ